MKNDTSVNQDTEKGLAFYELELNKANILCSLNDERINAMIEKRDGEGHRWLNIYLYYNENGEVKADLIGSSVQMFDLDPINAINEFKNEKRVFYSDSQ